MQEEITGLCEDKLSRRWFNERFYELWIAPVGCLIDGLLKNWCVVYRDDVVCGHYEVSSWTGAFYDLQGCLLILKWPCLL